MTFQHLKVWRSKLVPVSVLCLRILTQMLGPAIHQRLSVKRWQESPLHSSWIAIVREEWWKSLSKTKFRPPCIAQRRDSSSTLAFPFVFIWQEALDSNPREYLILPLPSPLSTEHLEHNCSSNSNKRQQQQEKAESERERQPGGHGENDINEIM